MNSSHGTTQVIIFSKLRNNNSVQPEVESAKMCYYPMVGKKKKKMCGVEKALKGPTYKACDNRRY